MSTEGPPQYQPPQYQPPTHRATNGLAIAALVCGIIGVLAGLIPFTFFLAFILGVLALVFGLIGRGAAKRREGAGSKQAIAGAILGGLAVILGVVGVVILVNVINDTDEKLRSLTTTTTPSFTTPSTVPGVTAAPFTTPPPTTPPTTITLAEYNAIQPGWTLQQVIDTVGGPGNLESSTEGSGFKFESYRWTGSGFGPLGSAGSASVQLQNDKVMGKSQYGLQ
jgi:vacuolar-type H+-ATPase subunit I/STV1